MKPKATTALDTVLRYSAERPLLSAMVAERAVWRVKCSVASACSSCRSCSGSFEEGCAGVGGTTGGAARASWAPGPTVAVMVAPFTSCERSVTPASEGRHQHRPRQVVQGAAHALGEHLYVGAGVLVGDRGEVELAGVGQHGDGEGEVAHE